MVNKARMFFEVVGVLVIVMTALWARDDSTWEPEIALVAGLLAYGQSLIGRHRAPTKKDHIAEFSAALETYRGQWRAEKRLQPQKLATARFIAKNIQWNLST
jgi:hypothetical protein